MTDTPEQRLPFASLKGRINDGLLRGLQSMGYE